MGCYRNTRVSVFRSRSGNRWNKYFKDGKTYYTLLMNDGMEIEYILDDCVEFLLHETKEEK